MNMLAIQLNAFNAPLELVETPVPNPSANEGLIKVRACGICRTDLHILDSELDNISLPIIPAHQIVGEIVELGKAVKNKCL
jgi:propanol-preferring alcohol dehydrogenase